MRRWRVPVVGGAVALLMVVGYLLGFHQPRRDEISRLDDDTEQLRAQQVALHRSIDALEEVEDRKPELDAAQHALEQLIPSALAQPSVLEQLQAAADAAGVTLASVTFGDPLKPEGAPESHVPGTVLVAMPVTVIVEGPFLRITDVLRRVELDVERAILVDTVALTEAEAGYPQLAATWSGRAFALLAADDPLLVDPAAAEAAAAGGTSPGTGTPPAGSSATPPETPAGTP